MKWSDNGGDIYRVFTRDDLLTHATIYWTGNAIASSIRTYANNNRYPWAPSHDRTPVIEAPTGITFVGYENPPGVNSPEERIESFLASDRAAWYRHINIAAHPRGGHFIPWEIQDEGTAALVETFRQRRSPRTPTTPPPPEGSAIRLLLEFRGVPVAHNRDLDGGAVDLLKNLAGGPDCWRAEV